MQPPYSRFRVLSVGCAAYVNCGCSSGLDASTFEPQAEARRLLVWNELSTPCRRRERLTPLRRLRFDPYWMVAEASGVMVTLARSC